VTFNQAQWAGNYAAGSIGAILLFARNLGATDLQVRLALGDASAPAIGGTWFATNVSVFLPAGSAWVPVIFHLGSGDLTRVAGTGTYADVMQSVVTLRILHSQAPSAFGDNVVATLGVDRIVALPEPGATPTLLSGITLLASCGALRARRRRAKA
jgi:hypothetical protein